MQKNPAHSRFPSLEALPALALPKQAPQALASDELCFALWDKYAMPGNIREHSLLVAKIAAALATRGQDLGLAINVDLVRQSALLHDLGKAYSLAYGGSHSMLGAGWVVAETGNYALAQGVLHHVHWPWPLPCGSQVCSLPLIVLYADKRAKHDQCVTLDERASDLLERYGHDQEARETMMRVFAEIKTLEQALADCLKWENLYADTFDSRGLVNRR
ncbi:MAG: HDIG domain-containing protein [Desulfovibrionaceae bacterium]|nr:HDIG domain-containing protein [Desulfovibrionaceae bacterium]